MNTLGKSIALAIFLGIAGANLFPAVQPAFGAEDAPVATSKRTKEDVAKDMDATGKQLQELMGSEDALFDPAKRAQIAPKAVPLLHQMISLFDEQVALNPELKPAVADVRVQILSLASFMGDAKADQMLADLTKSDNASQARIAQAAQMLVRWWKSPKDAAEQTKVVDDLGKLAKANPDDARFQRIFSVMAAKGAANDQIKDRVAALAASKPKE